MLGLSLFIRSRKDLMVESAVLKAVNGSISEYPSIDYSRDRGTGGDPVATWRRIGTGGIRGHH